MEDVFGNCVEYFGYISELFPHIDILDRKYFESYRMRFDSVYDTLYDDFSKKSLEAFINAKINMDSRYLWKYVCKPQYFTSFITHNSNEVFMDCGAFTGDTIENFIEWNKGDYSKIVAFEPDKESMKKLKLNTSKIHDILYISCACSDENSNMRFSQEDDLWGLRPDPNGKIVINTATIDSQLISDVSFLVMDIEGSEKQAIRGAKETIKRFQPILAISVYHKKEDVYSIFEMISELSNVYRFFFRIHKYVNVDAVLYAVPQDRIKE